MQKVLSEFKNNLKNCVIIPKSENILSLWSG